MVEQTSDTFFNGRMVVHQMRNGYRFSIDAVLLAATVVPKPGERLLDLGTGCGIIPLIIAFRHPTVHISAVEVQARLADLAHTNFSANHLQERIRLIRGDLRRLRPPANEAPFDWVMCNPPYRPPGSGRTNPNSEKALARHEILVDIAQVIGTAKRMLRTGGRFAAIFPAVRTVDLLHQMRLARIEPKWLQTVHSREGEPARLVMVHGINAARPGLEWAAPLVIYDQKGDYTPAVAEMFA